MVKHAKDLDFDGDFSIGFKGENEDLLGRHFE